MAMRRRVGDIIFLKSRSFIHLRVNSLDYLQTIFSNSIINDQGWISVFAFPTKAFMIIVNYMLVRACTLEKKQ